MVRSGSYPLIFVTGIVLFGAVYAAANAVWPSFYGEMFPAKVRLSGTALGTQLGFAFSGFVPTIIGACLVNIAVVITSRETCRVPTPELGLPAVGRPLARDAAGASPAS